jgi:hypothetical protein
LVAVGFVRGQVSMSTEQGAGAYNGADFPELASAQVFRLGRQPHALVVSESQPSSELLLEPAILSLEILDHLALLLVDPAG